MRSIKNDTYCSSTSHKANKKSAEGRDATSTTTRHSSVARQINLLPGGTTRRKKKPCRPMAAQKLLLLCGTTDKSCCLVAAQKSLSYGGAKKPSCPVAQQKALCENCSKSKICANDNLHPPMPWQPHPFLGNLPAVRLPGMGAPRKRDLVMPQWKKAPACSGAVCHEGQQIEPVVRLGFRVECFSGQ